jgi:hypothetical protein
MATMTLLAAGVNGGVAYSFPHDPRGMPRIRKQRTVSTMRTLESTASIDWGFKSAQSGLQGQRRVLRWSYLPTVVYDILRAFYETANPVTWNPQSKVHPGGSTYIVKIIALRAFNLDAVLNTMRDVELELEIVTVN